MSTDRRLLLAPIVALALVACSTSAGSSASSRPAASGSATGQVAISPTDGAEPLVSAGPASVPSLPPDRAEQPDRTVEESGGFRLTTLSSASCTAQAPDDWWMQAPDRSDRADLFSPDGSMYAGYGILPVNTALQGYANAYPPPMDDPDLYSDDPSIVAQGFGQIIVGEIGGTSDLATQEIVQPVPGYLLAVVGGSTHGGAIFFHETGYPGDGVNFSYALPMYFAFTTLDRWETQGALVAWVAASIRCATQFQPPNDYPVVGADDGGAAGDANGEDDGYNPQLGTEPVSDPATGDNYLVDPSVNWSEKGPDGPGYYVRKGGGDYQRLQPGRID